MPKNHDSKFVRKSQDAQTARYEKELAALARELHRKDIEPTRPTAVPFVNDVKERRRIRLEQKRLHKASGRTLLEPTSHN